MKAKAISLSDIAGYATERTVWTLLLRLADTGVLPNLCGIQAEDIIVAGTDFVLPAAAPRSASGCRQFSAPEAFRTPDSARTEPAGIWALGALAFFAITGMNVFEGKGGETQTPDTAIPRLGTAHASAGLSSLVRRCLSYAPQARPTADEVCQAARAALAQPAVPRKRLISHTGKTYARSIVKFWPEEMVPLLLLCLWFAWPGGAFRAQAQDSLSRSDIPHEMASLVLRCVDLRSPQLAERVSKAMDRDLSWTMMDELPIDKEGECTTKDPVDAFGLNDIGFNILKRHRGATNAGGRFRDGRDPRYKYSFIEITVKRDHSVSYPISGREGEQLFAIVPFDPDATFEANIPGATTFSDQGVCYIRLKRQIKETDVFVLTIKNSSGKNLAFSLINFNSRNHE